MTFASAAMAMLVTKDAVVSVLRLFYLSVVFGILELLVRFVKPVVLLQLFTRKCGKTF